MRRELWTTGKVICFHEIYGSRADYACGPLCTATGMRVFPPNDTGRKYLKARQPASNETNLVRSSNEFLPNGDYRAPIPYRHPGRASCILRSRNYGRNNISETLSTILWKLILIEKSTGEWEELRARRVY